MTDVSAGLARPADEIRRRPTNRLLRAFPALAVRDYRLLLGGVFLAMNGWMMQQVVLGWYVLETTDSAFQLGLVMFFNIIPTLFLSIPGGVLADRMDKRILMLITQVSTFVIYAVLALLIAIGQGHVWVVYVASFFTGLFLTLRLPAQQAIVVEIVGREALVNAIAISSASFNATRIVGPAMAAGLLATVGIGVSIFVIGLSYLAAGVAIWFLRYRGTPSVSGGLSFAENLTEGLKYAKDDGRVLALLALGGCSSLLVMPFAAFVPAFARDVLNAGVEGLGVLNASVGVGAFGSALFLALRGNRLPNRGVLLIVTTCVSGATIAAFALSSSYHLSIALMMLFGLISMTQMTLTITVMQLMVPDRLRGRMMGLFMLMWGFMPLGTLLIGLAAETFGVQAAVAAASALSLILVIGIGTRMASSISKID